MLKITIACKVQADTNRARNTRATVKVVGADVAYAVEAWNRCWWAQSGAGTLVLTDNTVEALVAAVLKLPTDLSATVTFGHK